MRNFGYSEEGHQGRLGDLSLWRRIIVYCLEYRNHLVCAILFSLVVTAASLLLPKLLQVGIDNYIAVENLAMSERTHGLKRIVIAYGTLIGVVFSFGFIQIVVLEWVGQSIMDSLRQTLFAKVLSLDLAFFHGQQTGSLVTRLTNDVHNMHEMFTSVMVTLFNDLLKLLGIFCFLYVMNARLALVMTIFVPVSFSLIVYFATIARKKFRKIRSQLAKLNAFIAESIVAVPVIQAFNMQAYSNRRYQKLTGEYLKINLSQVRLFAGFMPLTDLLSSVAVALIIWYGGGEVIKQHLTIGELVAFLSYMRLFFQPLRELSQKYSIVQSAMASAERIFQLLDTESNLHKSPPDTSNLKIRGNIRFEDVWFSYSSKTPVLSGVDFSVTSGETVALVGSTGAGKSTIINLLSRFYDPDRGRILLDGNEITEVPLQSLRQQVGVILQDVLLLPDTILKNIILDADYDEQRVERILDETGIDKFINKLPQGLHTLIGSGGRELSIGEKQLLSFVRAMYHDPVVLVLDEATASIDSESEQLLEKAVDIIFKDRTSLVIAHRLSTIRNADRILVMDNGKIAEQGNHQQLMAQGGIYSNLVKLDIKKTIE